MESLEDLTRKSKELEQEMRELQRSLLEKKEFIDTELQKIAIFFKAGSGELVDINQKEAQANEIRAHRKQQRIEHKIRSVLKYGSYNPQWEMLEKIIYLLSQKDKGLFVYEILEAIIEIDPHLKKEFDKYTDPVKRKEAQIKLRKHISWMCGYAKTKGFLEGVVVNHKILFSLPKI